MRFPWMLAGGILCAGSAALGISDPGAATTAEESVPARIVSLEDVRAVSRPASLAPLRVIAWPYAALCSGMQHGLVAFEEHRIRDRMAQWTETLRRRGVAALFGGMGEGTGFGGGGTYTLRKGENQTLRFLARATFSYYQEFDLEWKLRLPAGELALEGSHEWRPRENFYGLGHGSSKDNHSSFALRQEWAGARWEIHPARRLLWGVDTEMAWLSALEGENPAVRPIGEVHPGVTGVGSHTRLQSAGMYLDIGLYGGEYVWGALAHFGASYLHGLGSSRLRYFSYETQLEGRMPVASGRSALDRRQGAGRRALDGDSE